jgi:hypothetical protein
VNARRAAGREYLALEVIRRIVANHVDTPDEAA